MCALPCIPATGCARLCQALWTLSDHQHDAGARCVADASLGYVVWVWGAKRLGWTTRCADQAHQRHTCNNSSACSLLRPLTAADPPRPFDFLINDQLLRSTIQQHLLDNEMSAVSQGESAVGPCSHKSLGVDGWKPRARPCARQVILPDLTSGDVC